MSISALCLSLVLGAGPTIRQPVAFDTPEADRIVESLQVFPPDNPWNQDVLALAGASQLAEDHRLDRHGQAAADTIATWAISSCRRTRSGCR